MAGAMERGQRWQSPYLDLVKRVALSVDVASLEWLVLIEPGFRQRLVLVAQIEAQVDRIVAVDGQIELGSPVACNAVRHCFGEYIRESPARTRQHRFRQLAEGQFFQRSTFEFDHELAHIGRAWLTRLAAVAKTRGDAARQRRGVRLILEPMQAITQAIAAACGGLGFGDPHSDDVVVDFIIGRDFDQLYRSLAPAFQWLDPETWAALVMHAVLIMVEVAVTLQQAEAAWIVVAESRGGDAGRVVERAPDVFAVAVPDCQAVGVVDFRTPVGAGAFDRLREPQHRSRRRNAEAAYVLAQEQRAVDIHDHAGHVARIAPHDELVGANDAWAVQHGVHHDGIAFIGWGFEVEVSEVREFFRFAGLGNVDGDAACRQAVLIQVADGAEIGGAEEGDPVVLAPVELGLVAGAAFLKAETGEAAAARQLASRAVGGHVEVAFVVQDLARLGIVG